MEVENISLSFVVVRTPNITCDAILESWTTLTVISLILMSKVLRYNASKPTIIWFFYELDW